MRYIANCKRELKDRNLSITVVNDESDIVRALEIKEEELMKLSKMHMFMMIDHCSYQIIENILCCACGRLVADLGCS